MSKACVRGLGLDPFEFGFPTSYHHAQPCSTPAAHVSKSQAVNQILFNLLSEASSWDFKAQFRGSGNCWHTPRKHLAFPAQDSRAVNMAKLFSVLFTTISFMLASSSEVLLVKTMNNKFDVSCRTSRYFWG